MPYFGLTKNNARGLVAFCTLVMLYLSPLTQADVPELAKLKAAAEAGNPEAQYTFAKSFPVMGSEWTKWLSLAASQGYGPAEDELAWTPQGLNFSLNFPDPNQKAFHLKTNGAKMKQALIYASSAADKGFGRSRLLLAHAYGYGYFVNQDRVEAYKWATLSHHNSIAPYASSDSFRQELVKIMPLDDVKAGEASAKSYQPGGTPARIRNAMVIPHLKLIGLGAADEQRFAIVNGSRIKIDQQVQLNVDGLPVAVRCISIDEKGAVISLLSDSTKVLLRPKNGAEVIH